MWALAIAKLIDRYGGIDASTVPAERREGAHKIRNRGAIGCVTPLGSGLAIVPILAIASTVTVASVAEAKAVVFATPGNHCGRRHRRCAEHQGHSDGKDFSPHRSHPAVNRPRHAVTKYLELARPTSVCVAAVKGSYVNFTIRSSPVGRRTREKLTSCDQCHFKRKSEKAS